MSHNGKNSRRTFLSFAAAIAVSAAARPGTEAADARTSSIRKPIPSTGDELPVIGLGTNAFGTANTQQVEAYREVLRELPRLGGSLVDTARNYGESETVIGRILAELGTRDEYFLATKTPMFGNIATRPKVVEESFQRLQVNRIDLMQVHNLNGVDTVVPMLREYKQAGKIRYIGLTTSRDEHYDSMARAMRRYRPDVVQVDYSLANRGAERTLLPLARELGIAVIVNVPFGGRYRNLIAALGNRRLPGWASEFEIASWPQLLLKYVVSHPAVTAAVPGTTKLLHLRDNLRAAQGRLLDVRTRRRLESYWERLSIALP